MIASFIDSFLSFFSFSVALKSIETVNDGDFLELSSTSAHLFLSFDMDDKTNSPLASPARMHQTNGRLGDEGSSVSDITSFVNMIKSNSEKIRLEAVSALLHILSINHVNTGKLSCAMLELKDRYTHFHFSQNTRCFQNTVVECGAIPVLLAALDSPKQSVRDECVKCLSAIIGSSSYHRDCLIQEGGLTAL